MEIWSSVGSLSFPRADGAGLMFTEGVKQEGVMDEFDVKCTFVAPKAEPRLGRQRSLSETNEPDEVPG